MFRQQLYGGSATVTLSASLIGRVQGANAAKALAGLEVERNLEAVRAGVVSAQQGRIASTRSLPLAAAQLRAAQSAYDLARSGLQAGTAVMHNVLLALNDLVAAREAYDLAVVSDSEAQIQLLYATGQTAPATA
jgi:outer membrane protein TolC